jgi:nucleoside triphosphatase
VGALILNATGKMLLVRSHKWGKRYTIAGGHVEVGESLVAALRREIKEEVGIRIKEVELLLIQEAIFSPEFWKPKHFIFFDFVCRARDEQPKIDRNEIQSSSWVEPIEALNMDIDSYTRKMIEVYLSKVGRGHLGIRPFSTKAFPDD